MFTQKRTNLKIFGAVLFTMIFLVGGLFVNTTKGEAANTVQSFGVSYSLSPIISTTNNDGGVTTRILVGCAPKSGDLFDVNTGMNCYNNVKTVLVGCAAGSGDIYDVNTGKSCASYIKPVLVGCALKSVDKFDINTGKTCIKNAVISTMTKANAVNILAKEMPAALANTPKLTSNTNKTTLTNKAIEINSIASNTIETIPTSEDQNNLSGREKLKDNLTASAQRVGSIFKGPMSLWVILLIIIILLGGGYGVYSFKTKNASGTVTKTVPEYKKIETVSNPQVSKPITPETKPIIQEAKTPAVEVPHTNPNQANTQVPPIHTATSPNTNTRQ